MNRTARTLALPVAATAVLALTACGNADESSGSMGGMSGMGDSPSTSSATRNAQQNEADIAFATSMITHHRQAVDMAEMALKQASSAEVKALATKIKAAQDPEINAMSSWLKAWGKPVPNEMSGMQSMDGMSMDGMMTEQEMNDLSKATDVQFDRMWLSMMIKHHKGAVKMAQTEVAQGQNPEAKKVAQDIVTAQNAEIAEMTALLKAAKG